MKRTFKKSVKRASKSYIFRNALRDSKIEWETKVLETLGQRL